MLFRGWSTNQDFVNSATNSVLHEIRKKYFLSRLRILSINIV